MTTKSKQIAELNRQAQAIAEAHPDDYHYRADFQAIVDQRSALIKGDKHNENHA